MGFVTSVLQLVNVGEECLQLLNCTGVEEIMEDSSLCGVCNRALRVKY
jgi:hypothetical protein